MNIQDAIQRLAGNQEVYNSVAKVTSVNGSTCDVLLLKEDLELFDVRLQASSGKGMVITPKVGSFVLVSYLNSTNAYVTMFSEVESYSMETQDDSLKTMLMDLIAEVKKIQVTTPSGVSGTPIPTNITALEQINSRIKKFFDK